MPVKLHKPTSPGRRISSGNTFEDVTASRPEKSLLEPRPRQAGRNAQGKITVRHRGGGEKRLYRVVDFLQDRFDQPATVQSIEYDPNRTSRIALVEYPDAERRYVLAPDGLRVGDVLLSSRQPIEVKVGNRLELRRIPVGMPVHNVELMPGQGGVIIRSAGASAMVMNIEGGFAQLKLPSGEIRKVPEAAMASVGRLSNVDHNLIRWGKAGRIRWKGFRPTVRGKAMNPVDHPHGGGEGNQPIGMRHPKTPAGKPALGVPTRRRGKASDRSIVQRRS